MRGFEEQGAKLSATALGGGDVIMFSEEGISYECGFLISSSM